MKKASLVLFAAAGGLIMVNGAVGIFWSQFGISFSQAAIVYVGSGLVAGCLFLAAVALAARAAQNLQAVVVRRAQQIDNKWRERNSADPTGELTFASIRATVDNALAEASRDLGYLRDKSSEE